MVVWIDELPCEDVEPDSEAWQAFWDLYPSAMEAFYAASDLQRSQLETLAQDMKSSGCSWLVDIPTELLTEARNAGSMALWVVFVSILCI